MDYPAILPRNSAKSGSLVSCIGLCVADLMSQNESCYAVVYSGDQSLCNYGTLGEYKDSAFDGTSSFGKLYMLGSSEHAPGSMYFVLLNVSQPIFCSVFKAR